MQSREAQEQEGWRSCSWGWESDLNFKLVNKPYQLFPHKVLQWWLIIQSLIYYWKIFRGGEGRLNEGFTVWKEIMFTDMFSGYTCMSFMASFVSLWTLWYNFILGLILFSLAFFFGGGGGVPNSSQSKQLTRNMNLGHHCAGYLLIFV